MSARSAAIHVALARAPLQRDCLAGDIAEHSKAALRVAEDWIDAALRQGLARCSRCAHRQASRWRKAASSAARWSESPSGLILIRLTRLLGGEVLMCEGALQNANTRPREAQRAPPATTRSTPSSSHKPGAGRRKHACKPGLSALRANAKAQNRCYVPYPSMARDLPKKRETARRKELDGYAGATRGERGEVRFEAPPVGFAPARAGLRDLHRGREQDS